MKHLAIALLVAMVVALTVPLAAASTNYGDYAGDTMSFYQVTEDSTTDPGAPLYGTPTIIGDTLLFPLTACGSFAYGGATDMTHGTLTTTIEAVAPNTFIGAIGFAEYGDVSLSGSGTAATFAKVTNSIVVDVKEIDGEPVSGVTFTVNSAFSPSEGDWNLADDGNQAGIQWQGVLYVDVDVALEAFGYAGCHANKVDITMSNNLDAGSEPGTYAYIRAKETDGIAITPLEEIPTNLAPTANANGPYIVPATSWDGAVVVLNGSASSDPDGDPLTYSWKIGDVEIGTDAVITWQFPIGLTGAVTLTVTDPSGASGTAETSVTVTVIDVAIDIKPGSFPNSINLGSNGSVPVAFFTSETFDATTIDPLTVTLAGHDFCGLIKLRGKKNPQAQADLEDVDGDGDLDLVVHLETENLAIEPTDTMCTLGALTVDGFVVQGTDSINIVPPQ